MATGTKKGRTGGSAKKKAATAERLTSGRDKISIRGARQHNLKNIDLEIPRYNLIVISGLSGSGK